MYKNNKELQKMPIPQHQALQFVVLPASYPAYLTALADLNRFQRRISNHFAQETPLEFFSIQDGEVVLNQDFEKHLDRTRRYATEKEAELYQACENILAQMHNLEERFGNIPLIESAKNPNNITSIFYKSPSSGEIRLNPKAINLNKD
jgi:hypothetical protein